MFELDGVELTMQDLEFVASRKNMDFDTFLQDMKNKGLVEKQTDSATADPTVESSMDSGSDDGSSVFTGTGWGEATTFVNTGVEDGDRGTFQKGDVNHITQDEFLEISSGGFGGVVGLMQGEGWKGREAVMQDKLYEVYNPNRSETGPQFEQYGAGNNIRVTLPNGDFEEFELSGTGKGYAIESSAVKADHFRLIKFLDQKKEKEITTEKRTEFKEVLLNRTESLVFGDLDGNIAKDLSLLDLKDNDKNSPYYGKSYEFEAVKNFENAVEVKLPNGSSKIFNVTGLRTDLERGGKSVDKNKIINSILRYIESNPRNYEQTKEHNQELKKVEEKIAPFFEEENIKKIFGQDLNSLSATSRATMVDKLRTDLGLHAWQLFSGEDEKVFKGLTRDQQNDVIDNKINEYVATVGEKYKSVLRAEGNQDNVDLGLNQEDMKEKYFGKDGAMHSRYDNEYDPKIYRNQQVLYNPDVEYFDAEGNVITQEQAKKNIEKLKTLKANAGLGKKSTFFNMNTMEYEYNTTEDTDAGIYNVDNSVELENGITTGSVDDDVSELQKLMEDGKLTVKELEDKALGINLAVDGWQNNWKKDKQKFYLNQIHGDDISGADLLETGAVRGGVEDAGGGNMRTFVWATDDWAANNNHLLVDVHMPDGMQKLYNGHLSRMQLGVDLKRSRAVYDKVYGLNETSASINQESGWNVFGKGVVKSFVDKHTVLNSKLNKVDYDQEFRQATLDLMVDELGYEPTAQEKYDVKATYGETVGSATSGLPKMVLDFALADKVLGAIGLNKFVQGIAGNLRKGRYAIQTTKGTEKFNRSQLINHIKNTTGKVKPVKGKKGPGVGQEVKIGNPFKGVKPGSPKEAQILDDWITAYIAKTGAKLDDIMIPASFTNRALAVNTMSLFEGVKMEVAMQMPRFHGIGYDPEMQGEWGESFATGYGFGFMSGVVPWDKMYKGVMGTPARTTTKAKPGIFGTEAAYKGVQPFKYSIIPSLRDKQIAFKGIHDYFVAAPLNFYAGSQFGGFTNQLADAMIGNKEWGEWLEENYGDWDHVKKHALSELISGFAMRAHKFNRFDFASESRLMDLKNASYKKLREDVYELKQTKGKDGKGLTEQVFDPVTKKWINRPVKNYEFRKGKTEADAEKYTSLINMAESRLMQMQDMKMYLDPVLGPQKLIQDFKPLLEKIDAEKDTKFTFDYKEKGFNVKFIKPNKPFYNPKTGKFDGPINKSKNVQYQAIFNPRIINPGHVPHEFLHIAKHKMFGEDVMFRGKYIDGLIDIAKDMRHDKGLSLYEQLLEDGVLKEGQLHDYQQVKEWELFSYIGEFFRKEGNQEMLQKKYGFDRLAGFTDAMIREKFGVSPDRLNTRKELVEYYINYAKTMEDGRGVLGSLKHLEKFVSPIKTKRQKERREQFEKFQEYWIGLHGIGETKSLRSRDLGSKIKVKEKELKTHPAFVQWKEDKDTEKYLNNPEIKQIQTDLQIMRKNLKEDARLFEETTFGKETPIEKTINDFARTGNKLATEKEWNARGGGKEKAMLELQKDGGIFDGIVTRGISFPIQGRSRETWLDHVKNGIPGVDKGLMGMLERFNKGKWGTPEQNESLSGYINSQYQFRRGKVSNHYKENPLGESLQKKVGEGTTVGDKLLAPKEPVLDAFENVNILKEAFAERREIEFKEVVTVEGERKVKNEIPIEKEVFEKEGGWQETVLKNTPKRNQMEEMGYRDITDLAPKFTEQMYGVKLTDKLRKKPNDIGGETNLENGQNFVRGSFNVKVMEQALVDGKIKTQPRVKESGEPVTKTIKNSQRIADGLPSGTVKFDKGVSDALVGRSAFPRLGTLGELYHLATPKNYTRAELRKLGFETNPKPHKEGHWRAATGPGGRIFIKGKAKGQKLTGKDVETYIGIKDGVLTKLGADRSLGGKLRRLITEEGRHITEQVMTESMDLNNNIVANLKGGKSRSFWSKTLGKILDQHSREKFLEEVRSAAFHDEFYRQIETEFDKGGKGSPEKAVVNALKNHFELYKIKDSEFKITKEELGQIGKEIYKEFKFTSRPEGVVRGVVQRAYKAVKMPNSLEGVESKAKIKDPNVEIIDGPGGVFEYNDIKNGIVNEKELAKYLTEKYGVGAYEAHFLAGASGGGGIGKYKTIKDMINGNIHKLRYSVFRSANSNYKKGEGEAAKEKDITYETYAMLDAVYKEMASKKKVKVEDLKKYETEIEKDVFVPTAKRVEQTGVGDKKAVMKELGMLDKNAKQFNQKAADKLFENGEKNKDILLDGIEFMMNQYAKEKVSQRVVRQWVEMHAGNMFGLIKTSASLAVLPNVKMSDLMKEFPANVPKIDKKTGKPERDKQGNIIYKSNWVLEHITPAQHLKARIYDYILSKGDKSMKEAMELTLRDHHTTLIPEKYDTMVNKTLQADLPASHLPGEFPLKSRYYEAQHPSDFDLGLRVFAGRKKGEVYDYHPNLSLAEKTQKRSEVGKNIQKLFPKNFRKLVAKSLNSKNLGRAKAIDKALENGRRKQKARGMSTFDFDETVGMSENFVIARKGKETKRIASDKWPFVGEKMVKEGWKMDFSDFNKVTKGKPGPLMEKMKNQIKKYGPENVFILTARAPESAKAIHEYLKSEGIKIPLKNITGLGNSTGEAKALWMLEKFAEGYNDMYFVDDALPNVKAVKNVLDQLDIKSNVQVARQLKSQNLGVDINKIMEHSLDIGSEKVFSKAEAKVRGKDIKRRRIFMRDSAADLELLIEPLYGKGKKGIENKKWFKEEFIMPFERGIRDYNTARQSAKNDYMNLRKQNKDVVKEISKEVEGTTFTNDMAMRVYLWNKAGYKIPDLAKTTETKLVEHIRNNPKLQAYAEQFARITKQEKGLKEPGQNWWGETMAGEVTNINRGVSRKQYLQEWIDVKNELFTEANLNKMESKLGTRWRENIEDMFDRMETGRTRSLKMDRGSAAMMNYLNGGIGTIMNFNTRSAALQTISTVNFLNMRENNPIAAARAMGNVKQFAKDFKFIMNSDMLRQRRDGLAINVTEAELASAAASSTNPIQSIIAKVLKAGYLPTKMADSFAISFGGATFYRNRIKMYEKQGMKTKEAEKQAGLDFQVIAERTQQSSRADLLSKEQTSLIGRFLLPFANTPMQMNRLGIKEILDLSKGRYKDAIEAAEKVGKISYYMGAQVAVFAGLQSALFAMLLNDDDVSDEKLANTKSMMLNTTTDSMLRGFGIPGATMSAFKNATQEYFKQSAKGYNADYSEVAEDLLNISPPIGSKFGMLDRAGDTKKWAKIKGDDKFKFELGNPSLEASLMTVQAVTNAPVYSPYQNMFNLKHAMSDQYETWQRFLMATGWTPYSVGVETDKKKKKKKSSKSDTRIKITF